MSKQPERKKQPDTDFTWVDDYEEKSTKSRQPSRPAGEEEGAEELFAEPPKREKIDLALEDTQEETLPPRQETTLRKRQAGRRNRRSYKRTALVVLAAICVVLVVGVLFSQTFSDMLRHNTSYTLWETEERWELSGQSSRVSAVLNDLVLSGDGDGLSAYAAPQSLVWNINYQMTEPVMRVAEDYVLVMDVGGKNAVICSKEGLLYQVVTQYPILTGSINKNGWVTLIGEEGLEHEILVYSNTGSQVLRRITSGTEASSGCACTILWKSSPWALRAACARPFSSWTRPLWCCPGMD